MKENKTMNVYEARWNCSGYGNGLMIIAANNEEEAKQIIEKENKEQREYWAFVEKIPHLQYNKKETTVITKEYYQE